MSELDDLVFIDIKGNGSFTETTYVDRNPNYCIECGVELGEYNMRQLCYKTYCISTCLNRGTHRYLYVHG